ncbi:8336_t:CDS:1, partial [Racocetra persica]
ISLAVCTGFQKVSSRLLVLRLDKGVEVTLLAALSIYGYFE